MGDPDPHFVKLRRGYIDLLIYPNKKNGYPIEHHRMDTPEKVLGWIHHLCEKGNVTTDHIDSFLHAAETIGVKINYHS